ncbi:MAG: hypothetical protein OXI34_03160 [Chloroflexota bacterium]|nr:hypothetical protein [Chloroflexota bacterium]MDE2947800.1 hypothetical protein [Chloroflexota bacterium]
MTVYELLEKAKKLDQPQQIELIKLLVDHLASQPSKPKRSLSELQGLGKEIWEGVDAQEYINELRGK